MDDDDFLRIIHLRHNLEKVSEWEEKREGRKELDGQLEGEEKLELLSSYVN